MIKVHLPVLPIHLLGGSHVQAPFFTKYLFYPVILLLRVLTAIMKFIGGNIELVVPIMVVSLITFIIFSVVTAPGCSPTVDHFMCVQK